jgi:hypothetical protein
MQSFSTQSTTLSSSVKTCRIIRFVIEAIAPLADNRALNNKCTQEINLKLGL